MSLKKKKKFEGVKTYILLCSIMAIMVLFTNIVSAAEYDMAKNSNSSLIKYDLIIDDGTIIDGTGNKRFNGDIGIKDGRIIKIADEIKGKSKKYIDADGLIVSPGFIDMHGHSDFTLHINNKGESKIRQGITTEVTGNCGGSGGPVTKKHFSDLLQFLATSVIMDDALKAKWNWKTQKEFVDYFSKDGLSFNIVPLVGHGTIRVAVMGFDKRKPTEAELKKMLKLLRNDLESGLFGLSTGLEYEPEIGTQIEELIAMCKVVKEYNGIYTTHLRNEGRDVHECIKQAIEIGKQTGVSVEISHLKSQYKANWGGVKESLDLINKANKAGVNIDFDVYPYIAFVSGLSDLIPPAVKENGTEKMIKMLKDKSSRAKAIEAMKEDSEDWENPMLAKGWDKSIKIASLKTEKNKKYEGSTIYEIAKDMKCSPYEAVIRLTIEEDATVKAIYFAMCEEDLEMIMKNPRAIFCTDGGAAATYGPLSKGAVHPRYYGTYPRILGRYVREKKIMPLEEAIKKSTFRPAEKLQLKERGIIKEGYHADITIFDAENIIDTATFDNPHQYPTGIEYVVVNGTIVINKGEHTGKLPGKVLNKQEN